MRGPDGQFLPTELSLEERLLLNSTPTIGGCRVWNLAKSKAGYGYIKVSGKQRYAHRVALELKLGRPLREGMESCHSCHNPPCVEQDHLREDTRLENKQDSIRSERIARGGHINTAKLTSEKVRKIRSDPRKYQTVAGAYGVDKSTVWRIKARKSWAWVK